MPLETDELNPDTRAVADSVTLRPEDSTETISALDDFAAEISGKKPDATSPVKTPEELAAEAKAAEDAAAAAKAAEPAKAADAPAAKTPEEVEAERVAAAAAEAAAAAAAKDPLDEIELPPHTKPKTAESFGKLRDAAKGLVAAATEKANTAQAEIVKLQQQIEELKKNSGQVPEAIQKELEDLRASRSVQDLDNDPEIKKFDDQVRANEEVIYKRLQTAGYSQEHINRIKELGGPDHINWEPIFEKMTLPARRFIEATLVESERLRQQKDTALTKARANVVEYSKGRNERETRQVSDIASTHVKGLTWANKQEVPAGATPEQRAAIEASNKYAEGAQTTLQKYLSDRSPERFAEMAVGTLIAHKLNADVIALRAAQKDNDTKLAAITKERDELKTKLEGIKKAAAPRGRTDPVVPPQKKAPVTEVSGTDNLDALAQEEHSRAADE